MSTIRRWWRLLPPAIRAGVTTGWQTFTGAALLAVLGLLDGLRAWVEGGDPPDFSNVGRLVGAAFIALASAVVTTVYRYARPPAISYPDAELDPPVVFPPGGGNHA